MGNTIAIQDSFGSDGVYRITAATDSTLTLGSGRADEDVFLLEVSSTVPAMTGTPTLNFTSASGNAKATIARSDGDWTVDGFEPGNLIIITGSSLNNRTVLIESVSDDGLVLTLASGQMLLNEQNVTTAAIVGDPTMRFIREARSLGSLTLTFADDGTANPTITRPANSGSWTTDGFRAGQHIQVTNTSLNNGTFQIASISSDGRTVHLIEDDVLEAETVSGGAVEGLSTIVHHSGDFLNDNFSDSAKIQVTGTGVNDGVYNIALIAEDGLSMALTAGVPLPQTADSTTATIRLVEENVTVRAAVVPAGGQPITAQQVEENLFATVGSQFQVFDKLPFGAQVLFASTTSNILIGSGARLTASGDVLITSLADGFATLKMPGIWLGVTYVESEATSTAIVEDDVTITAGNHFALLADVQHQMGSLVKIKTGLNPKYSLAARRLTKSALIPGPASARRWGSPTARPRRVCAPGQRSPPPKRRSWLKTTISLTSRSRR